MTAGALLGSGALWALKTRATAPSLAGRFHASATTVMLLIWCLRPVGRGCADGRGHRLQRTGNWSRVDEGIAATAPVRSRHGAALAAVWRTHPPGETLPCQTTLTWSTVMAQARLPGRAGWWPWRQWAAFRPYLLKDAARRAARASRNVAQADGQLSPAGTAARPQAYATRQPIWRRGCCHGPTVCRAARVGALIFSIGWSRVVLQCCTTWCAGVPGHAVAAWMVCNQYSSRTAWPAGGNAPPFLARQR